MTVSNVWPLANSQRVILQMLLQHVCALMQDGSSIWGEALGYSMLGLATKAVSLPQVRPLAAHVCQLKHCSSCFDILSTLLLRHAADNPVKGAFLSRLTAKLVRCYTHYHRVLRFAQLHIVSSLIILVYSCNAKVPLIQHAKCNMALGTTAATLWPCSCWTWVQPDSGWKSGFESTRSATAFLPHCGRAGRLLARQSCTHCVLPALQPHKQTSVPGYL